MEGNVGLLAENRTLSQRIAELETAVEQLEAALQTAVKRIEGLEGKNGGPPPWVKASRL